MTAMNLVVLYVTDLERSRRFHEALGLEFVREQHHNGPVHYACERNGLVLELYPARAGAASTGCKIALGFHVDSISAVLQRIAAVGDGVVTPTLKPDATRLRIRDPDGHTVFVTTEGPTPGGDV